MLGTIFGAAIGGGMGALNNYLAEEATSRGRRENYKYGEMAAENADARTRALYSDFYSPQAILAQYNAAGLSPSLMFGHGPSPGGQSGAQGSGAAGNATPYMPISLIEHAQLANLAAQTAKTKAETKNVQQDTENKGEEYFGIKYQNEINQVLSWATHLNWNINNSNLYNKETGQFESYFNVARRFDNYDDFSKFVTKIYAETNPQMEQEINTEQGSKILRDIYSAAHKYDQEIKAVELLNQGLTDTHELNEEQKKLLKWENKLASAMDNAGFAQLNAQAGIKYLKAQIQESELTEQQKQAWNNLIGKLDGSDWKDVIIVLGMILNNAASNWNNPVSFTKKL